MVVLKFKLLNWRFCVSALPVVQTEGFYSELKDGKHMLMWDFDGTTLKKVSEKMLALQALYALPTIRILNTGKRGHYHAQCWKRTDFQAACQLLTSIDGIDMEFFRVGVYRRRWTLRIGEKCGREIKLAALLYSPVKEDCDPNDLKCFVKYDTTTDGYVNKTIDLEREKNDR